MEPPLPGYNQYFQGGVKCLAQGHNIAKVGFEPLTYRSGVRRFTTEPPRSLNLNETLTVGKGKNFKMKIPKLCGFSSDNYERTLESTFFIDFSD